MFNAERFNPAEWCGVLEPKISAPTPQPIRAGAIESVFHWYRAALPTYAQRTDDCVGHATANACEGIIRHYVPAEHMALVVARVLGEIGMAVWQCDGNKLWKLIKDDKGEPYEGGAYMPDGFESLIKHAIMPAAKVVDLPKDLAEVAFRLRMAPVLQGTKVHHGWGQTNRFGYVECRNTVIDLMGGHATQILNVLKQDTRDGMQWYLDFMNSWGNKWGWSGIGMIHEADWRRSVIQLVTIEPEAEWKAFALQLLENLADSGFIIPTPPDEE